MLRWRGGYVAVGAPVASGEASRTPMWVSADGGTWHPLDAGVLGPATIVLGLAETAEGIVAMTLHGGRNQCDDSEAQLRASCWTPTLPLETWTSPDGLSWAAHPGPPLALRFEEGIGVDPPIFRAGAPGLLAALNVQEEPRAATSPNGVSWEVLPARSFSAQFGFGDNVGAFRPGFVAVGEEDAGDTIRAVARTSSDGRHWTLRRLPTAGFAPGWIRPGDGTSASRLVVGPAGIIAQGSVASAPGGELWWSSLDGRTWKPLPGFPPLGIWFGGGEAGSGLSPNGTLLGNGERMLAYRSEGNDAAWTSFDGRSWRPLAISGPRPQGQRDAAILMPVGLMWIGSDGSTWLGEPVT